MADTTDKPIRDDVAPKITFEDGDSYYAWFREASGWVGAIRYHDDTVDERVIVQFANDDGLVIAGYDDNGPQDNVRTVLYNQIDTFTVA